MQKRPLITTFLIIISLSLGAAAGFFGYKYLLANQDEATECPLCEEHEECDYDAECTKRAEEELQEKEERINSALNSISEENATEYVKHLSQTIGVRGAGSTKEKEAANYLKGKFEEFGYETRVQEFDLKNGTKSQNVIAFKRNEFEENQKTLVIGAHYDSVAPVSPGANDNGSGVAVMLESARILAKEEFNFNITYIAFGSEEKYTAGAPSHSGSTAYFTGLTDEQKTEIFGMINLDMLASRDLPIHVVNMGTSSYWLTNRLMLSFRDIGYDPKYERAIANSDHAPFEEAGIPIAFVITMESTYVHNAGDTLEHMDTSKLKTCGKAVVRVVYEIEEEEE